ESLLREDEEGGHAFLSEKSEELVKMQKEEALFRHCIEVAVQTVDDDDAHAFLLDRVAHEMRELARLHLRGIDLAHRDHAAREVVLECDAEGLRAIEHAGLALLEEIDGDLLSASRGGGDVLRRQRG